MHLFALLIYNSRGQHRHYIFCYMDFHRLFARHHHYHYDFIKIKHFLFWLFIKKCFKKLNINFLV